MADPITRTWLRLGAAFLLGAALGACAAQDQAQRPADASPRIAQRDRARPPAARPLTVPRAEARVAADPAPTPPDAAPEEPPLLARPEPGTGLPPGWYVPEPPDAPEAAAELPVALDPVARIAGLLRQNPWLTRFWSELTPGEQSRVTRALARRGAPGPAPNTWDPMGLADRVELLFGPLRAASG
ncbi:MAG: hypothetical protein RLZZ187_873 [Pseudomonadota bacterium]|jgi:hypothetical protein